MFPRLGSKIQEAAVMFSYFVPNNRCLCREMSPHLLLRAEGESSRQRGFAHRNIAPTTTQAVL